MDLELEGRRALVTGSRRGIGKAVADELGPDGIHVVVTLLCSPKARAIQGDAIPVGGGRPGAIDC
jgi:NAD(P)-dependent dehydrogenase (short-subunit alcohol dehydrogenase family)